MLARSQIRAVDLPSVSEFGLESSFGGPGELAIIAVVPIATNAVLVEFDKTPLADDTTGPHSVTNPRNWAVVAVDPTYFSDTVPEGIPTVGAVVPSRQPLFARLYPEPDTETQLIIEFDGSLEARVVHALSMSPGVCGALDENPIDPLTWYFVPPSAVPLMTPARVVEERYRDFDFVMSRKGVPISGVYRIDDSGDIGIQGGKESLRKRIFRRLFSGRNSWSFLRDYGVAVGLKSLATRAELQSFASRAAEQIRREPDVAQAVVAARMDVRSEGAFLIVDVWVTAYSGLSDKYLYEHPVT